jgi:hypothetical protein
VARFKIVTSAGPVPADHSLEMESLAAIGAEIVEVKGGEDELAAAGRRLPTQSTARAGRASPRR